MVKLVFITREGFSNSRLVNELRFKTPTKVGSKQMKIKNLIINYYFLNFMVTRNGESRRAPSRCLCDWNGKNKWCRRKAFLPCEWGRVSSSDLFWRLSKGNGGTGMVSLQCVHACVLSCEQSHLWSKNKRSCRCRRSPSPIPWLLPRQSLDHHCSASPVEDAILLMNPRKSTYQRKLSIKS